MANEACDAGRILVNDKVAKASLNIKPGDIIEIHFGDKMTKVEVLRENALKVNHHLQIFEVSATKGDGMDAWCDWLQTESAKCK